MMLKEMTDDNITRVDYSCQETTLWNDDIFSGSAPKFPDCFQNTVLVWVPCGFLLLCSPFQIASLCSNYVGYPLPLGIRSVMKSILCIVLASLTCANLVLSSTRGYHCESAALVPEEFYIGAGALIFVFVYLAVLTQALRKNHVISSGILITFWILLLGCSTVPLQSAISYRPSCVTSIIYYVYFTIICVQFVLYSFADKPGHPHYTFLGQKENSPEETASVLNRWVFWWFNGLVLTAYRRTLDVKDLWKQVNYLRSETCVPELEQNWKDEVHRQAIKNIRIQQRKFSHAYLYQNRTKNESTPLISNQKADVHDDEEDPENFHRSRPSLLKVVAKTYWKQWLLSSFYKILCDVLSMIQPLLLKLMIDFLENKHTQDWPLWNGWGLAILFFISGAVESLFFTQSAFCMMTLGLKVKVALVGMIYKKSLTMSNAAKSQYTIGDIVNLMSVDCQRIQDAFMFQYEIISFFFTLALGLYLIWNQMGAATLGSFAVIIIISALNIFFGKLQQKYQGIILALKSSRIKLLNEVLSGIKVLKMYTWEPSFTKKLLNIRSREMVFLKKVCVVTAFSTLFSVHSPFMMSYFVLLIFTLMTSGNYLNASKVFVSLSIINTLRFTITMVPFVITGIIQMLVSIKRIEKFLCKEDLNLKNVSTSLNTGYAIAIDNGYFTWDRKNPRTTLNRINLKIGEGKLVAVVGQVGAGKSSLVAAMLGEMEKVKGHVNVQGSVAYVPQEAWIQNLTVKENILFGSKFSEKKYKRIIQACALLPDLAILSAGDNTEIGERGINVSGGQKQRISLARAVYSNSDIYLLDDPLSAVDSHVGKSLFKEVIGQEGLLRHKTRILVTHGVHWLPKVDLIVVMDEGTISEIGTYEELMQKRGAFSEFLETYLLHGEDDTDSESDDEIVAKIKDEMWEQLECVSDYGLSADDSDLSRRQSARKASLRRNSRFSIPTDIKRRLSQLNAIAETSFHSLSKTESQRRFSRSNSKRRLSRQDKMNTLEKLQRSLSQGRILPYDSGRESEHGEGKLIQDEKSEEGTVKFSVILTYIKAMGVIGTVLSMLFVMLFQGLNAYGNFWLTFWTEDEIIKNQTLVTTQEYSDRKYYYLAIYTVLGVLQGIFLFLFAYLGLTRLITASGSLHSSMLFCILRSPMSFFDTTPVGRIMNRFSSDIDILDDRLPRTFRLWAVMLSTLLAILVVISVNTPNFLIVIIPVGILYILILRFYLPTARQLKRIEGVTRSPVYNHFSESITGASCIRAYRAVDRFITESQVRVDTNSTFYHAANTASWWIAIRLEFLANLLVLAAAVFSVLSDTLSGAGIGLSLTYSLQVVISLNLVVQSVSEMEMNIVSAERVEEFTRLQPEAEWIEPKNRPSSTWPDTGEVEFKSYTTRYRAGLDLVLRGLDCVIKGGEKIGIVGRTGAGKSSVTLAMFRIIEPAGGDISIDDVPISSLGLHDLRSQITILPQDPVIFSGSIRANLDPLQRFSDQDLWVAIERAHMKDFVTSCIGQLNYECGEGGQNFSVGQRQLVCLARTLLHKTKILILDEATAAVDVETDELIQNTIKSEFSDCTVLSIAHRLNTVMDYDRIMVMDQGLIVEFGAPQTLLEDKSGVFYSMAKDANLVN
ncbi:multidrug resistance-associated protein 1-like [Saccostrea echinata]|uniref:multidrug resistance-associated protein 1-like n=1 Tax=Saccostrea echinata TaxID=191078 RepID=UPI002A830C7D|nr:multidrug resistance-associated protein 1-like [Saccostrea echinata]